MSSCPVEFRLHHVCIFVKNIEESVKWYEDILGFKRVYRNDFPLPGVGLTPMAWVKGYGFYIEFCEYPEHTKEETTYYSTLGTKHLSLCVEDGKWDELYKYIKESGVQVIVDHKWDEKIMGKEQGCRVLFILDPSGNQVELQELFTPDIYVSPNVVYADPSYALYNEK